MRLRSFARDFFVDANEFDLVRPLCLLLGFLNVEDDRDLRSSGASVADLRFEGTGGGLELLHPWQELVGWTKYQALFHPSPAADKIRTSFFTCRKDVVIAMLEVLMEEVGSAEHRALLARGRDAVLQRLHCYDGASLPESCTPQLAWDTLRKAMAEERTPMETYYFSVQDLRLLSCSLK